MTYEQEPGRPTANVDVELAAPARANQPIDFEPAPQEKLNPMLEVEIVAANSAVICVPKGNQDATTITTSEAPPPCVWVNRA